MKIAPKTTSWFFSKINFFENSATETVTYLQMRTICFIKIFKNSAIWKTLESYTINVQYNWSKTRRKHSDCICHSKWSITKKLPFRQTINSELYTNNLFVLDFQRNNKNQLPEMKDACLGVEENWSIHYLGKQIYISLLWELTLIY